jgi:hypothetical protein
MFDDSDPEVFQHADVLSIDKSTVLDKSAATIDFNVANRTSDDFTLTPVVFHDAQPGDPMWFVRSDSGADQIHVVRMEGVLTATPTFTDTPIDVDAFGAVPSAPQLGGTFDAGDTRMLSAQLRDGRLVAAHTAGVGGEAEVRWYEFNARAERRDRSRRRHLHVLPVDRHREERRHRHHVHAVFARRVRLDVRDGTEIRRSGRLDAHADAGAGGHADLWRRPRR